MLRQTLFKIQKSYWKYIRKMLVPEQWLLLKCSVG